MSRCLKDDEVQAIADNEGPAEHRAHAAQCPRCAGAVAARISLNARVADAAGRGELPADMRAAIRSRLNGRQAAGATTLRTVGRMPRWAWALPLAAAAAGILLVVVLPGIDRQTTVSAADASSDLLRNGIEIVSLCS